MRSGLAGGLALAGALALAACSVGATPTADPAPATTPTPGVPEPPRAVLLSGSTELGDGQVGSYSIGSWSSDSPWLPGTAATIAAASPLTVELKGGLGVSTWTASYVPIDSLTTAVTALGAGSGPVAFAGPPGGHWSVLVFALFEGGGSAAFYWDLLVEQP